MITVTIDTRTRSGRADGPLVALQDNALRITGADLPAGARVVLADPDGRTLAAATTADDQGNATLDCATQEAAAAVFGRRLDQRVQAFLLVGDDAALFATVPLALLPNALPPIGTLPPAPLPPYWTAEETRAAIEAAVSFAGERAQVLNEAKDNWGTCWGFAFDLQSLSPGIWSVPGESAARLFNIQLRASDNAKYFAEPKTVRLRLVDEATGLDARSDNAIAVSEPLQWLNFHFSDADPEGLRLPAARAVATFVDEETSEATEVPIRITTVGAQPEGCALITNAQGNLRNDLFPHLNTLNFALDGPTFAAAIVALRDAVDAKQDALVAGENIAIEGNVISATGVDPTTSARIAALEQGRGIYKDPKTGKVSLYTPLPECPDGTLKVIMDLGFGTKILPVEEADSESGLGCFDDGEHLFLFHGGGDLSTAWGYKPPIYVYDKDLNRICRKSGDRLWFGGGEVLRFAKDWSAFIHIYGDHFFFQGNDGRIFRMDLQDDTMPERNIPNPGDSPIALWHNPLTGHLCHLSRTSAGVWHIRVYDDDLNAVAGEDGRPLVIDVTDVCVSAKLQIGSRYGAVAVKHIYGRAYVFSAGSVGGAILQAQVDDSLAILREATVQEDPDNPGKVLCEKQANGNPVRDDPSLNVLKRPITTPGPEIRFNTPVAAEREYAANAWHAMPRFYRQLLDHNWVSWAGVGHNCWFLTDGLDTWYILSDGRAIRCDQYHIAGGGVNGLPNYTKAPLKGIQDCLTNATPTSVVPVFMAGVGGNTWGTNYGIAMFASQAQFGDEHGFSQNLALRVKTNQTAARNVTTDGLLPFWPKFNLSVVNNACVGESGSAFVGCPVWYVNFDGIANRTL